MTYFIYYYIYSSKSVCHVWDNLLSNAIIDAMHKELETTFKKEYEDGKVYLMAASSSTAEITADWISQIRESFPGMDVMCDDLSLGLSCHIGPDGLGIGCSCMPL